METDKVAQTDVGYINEILHHFYHMNRNISIKCIYMEGKHKYNQRTIQQKIKQYQRMFQGETIVLYVFDKDEAALDIRDAKFNEEIKLFCEANKYELIWFVKNVEHVMHGKIIPARDKKKMIDQFKRNHRITSLIAKNLESPNP